MTDEKESTFLVTHVESSAVLKDVHDGQVHTLSSNPGLTVDDALGDCRTRSADGGHVSDCRDYGAASSLDSGKKEPPTVHERELATETETGASSPARNARASARSTC